MAEQGRSCHRRRGTAQNRGSQADWDPPLGDGEFFFGGAPAPLRTNRHHNAMTGPREKACLLQRRRQEGQAFVARCS